MPNKKGGKKFKKGKKQSFHEKTLIYKDPKEDQEYGKIIGACGNGRFNVSCFDGKDRLGIIAGNMRKKIWVNKDDIVLISRWDFTTDNEKCSIIHKYDSDEAKKLHKEGEFPENIKFDSEFDLNDPIMDDMISFEYNNPESDHEDNKTDSESEGEINIDEI